MGLKESTGYYVLNSEGPVDREESKKHGRLPVGGVTNTRARTSGNDTVQLSGSSQSNRQKHKQINNRMKR